MAIPSKFNWILKEPGPLMVREGMKEYGTIEGAGSSNNRKIISWAREVGASLSNMYVADSIPWCGLYMAVIAKRANKIPAKSPLWALNWGTFGKYVQTPMFGDVLVFVRRTAAGRTAGHVGIYIAESKTSYFVLGGNQSDAVCIKEFEKKRLYTSRRPSYKTQPTNVRRIFLTSTGRFSNNEQ